MILKDESWEAKVAAIEAAVVIRKTSHIPEVISSLKSSSIEVRFSAIFALQITRDRKAVGPLIECLRERDLRHSAWLALKYATGLSLPAIYEKWKTWHQESGK